ncbi:hypothetical protein BC827DRAFT_1378919 [Russula dissimulans]|nr:hypothetical protein BC827DRAFT_1378919 [Russula dissimulans]
MPLSSTSIRLSSVEGHRRKLGRPSGGRESKQLKRHHTYIHVLDDDSLLHMFSLCRPILLDREEGDDRRTLQGGDWDRERWWYKLVQVCKRWRCLIFGSASYLGLSLLCTYGTPMAMLTHSPPLPLTIDYVEKDRSFTAEDEKIISFALQHRDRVRRIRFWVDSSNILRRLLLALNEEFPNLEHLYIRPLDTNGEGLTLPESFQAPNIRHLVLVNFALPLGSPLLVTTAGLVTLSLQEIPSSMYFRPDELLRWLSFMPQIETLGVGFYSALPNRDVEGQLLHMPITTHITLSKLRWFGFEGVSAYLAALLPWMTTPLLKKIEAYFSDRFMSSVPSFARLISENNNLRSNCVKLGFYDQAVVACAYPHDRARMYTWRACFNRRDPDGSDWRVGSRTARLHNALRPALSSIVDLILEYDHSRLPACGPQVDRTHWREILGSFGNVNTLHVPNCLIGEVSRSLKPENGESPMDVLPQLKKLSYSGSPGAGDKLMPFIKARLEACRPITLTREPELPLSRTW